MKASVLTTILTCMPALLAAQQATAAASATAQANVTAPATYSAESRAKIDAAFQAARAKNLPDEPMRQRLAEGQAKGATEAQVVAAIKSTETRLEASQSALIKAGRANPKPEEVASGEQAIARGATEAQIEALVKAAPTDQSLVASLDGLLKTSVGGNAAANGGAAAGVNAAAGVGKAATAGVTGAVKGAVSGVLPPKKP